MSEFFKRTAMQDILVVTGCIAFIVATLLNMTSLVYVSIGGGFIAGLVGARFWCKKKWKELSTEYCPIWKRWFWMAVVAAIVSQIGWAAALV